MRWAAAAAIVWLAGQAVPGLGDDALARQAGLAFFERRLDNPRERREARADILDTPVRPGSIVKAVALVAGLERGVIRPNMTHMCRRATKADGQVI